MSFLKSSSILLVTVVASLITIVMGVKGFWDPMSRDGRVGLVFFGLLSFLLLGFVAVQEYRFSRKARYAEALNQIHLIYSICSLRSATKALVGDFQNICDHLAQAYGLITGTRCSACLKILNQKMDESQVAEPRPFVTTLCRDANSIPSRQFSDDEITHWLDENTDFEMIFRNLGKPMGRAFLSNNLCRRAGYRNTSFTLYGGEPGYLTIPYLDLLVRYSTWPLPYKSTIVSPILAPGSEGSKPHLLGSLCVDSRSRGVFRERYDIEMMCSIAGALYPLLDQWCKKRQRRRH